MKRSLTIGAAVLSVPIIIATSVKLEVEKAPAPIPVEVAAPIQEEQELIEYNTQGWIAPETNNVGV